LYDTIVLIAVASFVRIQLTAESNLQNINTVQAIRIKKTSTYYCTIIILIPRFLALFDTQRVEGCPRILVVHPPEPSTHWTRVESIRTFSLATSDTNWPTDSFHTYVRAPQNLGFLHRTLRNHSTNKWWANRESPWNGPYGSTQRGWISTSLFRRGCRKRARSRDEWVLRRGSQADVWVSGSLGIRWLRLECWKLRGHLEGCFLQLSPRGTAPTSPVVFWCLNLFHHFWLNHSVGIEDELEWW